MLNQYDDFKPQLLKGMSVNTGGNVNRSKYPPELRSFAITLHFYSPKAYNFVRKKFNLALPHPSVHGTVQSTRILGSLLNVLML